MVRSVRHQTEEENRVQTRGADHHPEDGQDAPGQEEVQAEVRDADEDQPTRLAVTEARSYGEESEVG